MKYMKVQMELLKAVDGRKKNKFKSVYFITENKVWVCPDGSWMMGIPKELFYLDDEKIWKDTKPIHGESHIDNLNGLEPATDTHITINVDKMNLHKFNVKDEAIFISEKYLNYFEPDATFKGTKRNAPIYVYEFDELVGMICPVNYKEKG